MSWKFFTLFFGTVFMLMGSSVGVSVYLIGTHAEQPHRESVTRNEFNHMRDDLKSLETTIAKVVGQLTKQNSLLLQHLEREERQRH